MEPFFRQEALDAQQESQFGGVVLVQPLSFTLFAMLAAVIVITLLALFFFGSYTQKVAVHGTLQPAGGVTRLASERAATITAMKIKEGDTVHAGQALFSLSAEKENSDGTPLHAAINKTYDDQIRSLGSELTNQKNLADQEKIANSEKLAQLNLSLSDLSNEIENQKAKIEITDGIVQKYAQLNKTRYISDIELKQQQGQLLDEKVHLSELDRSMRQLKIDIHTLQIAAVQLPLKFHATTQPLQREINSYQNSLLQNDSERENTVVAPVDGTVSGVILQQGQSVRPGQTIVTIVPAHSRLEAELYVPSDGIGFIRPGNRVVLHFDAYPYQTYGLQYGQVLSVSRNTFNREELPGQNKDSDSTYRVQVRLDHQAVVTYGNASPLHAGETLEAQVLVRHKTIREWLFDPIYALRGRL